MGYRSREGILSWFRVRRYAIEKTLFLLHRLTGIGIGIFFVIHFFITGWSPGSWGDELLGLLIVFHFVNGLRLILTENGFLLGRPYRPVFPFKQGVLYGTQRYLVYAMLLLFFVLMAGWTYYALLVG